MRSTAFVAAVACCAALAGLVGLVGLVGCGEGDEPVSTSAADELDASVQPRLSRPWPPTASSLQDGGLSA